MSKRLPITNHLKFSTIVLAGLLAACCSLISVGSAHADDGLIATIKARGVLRAAGPVFQPFIIRKPDGSYEGMDVDLLGEFANSLGVKLEIVDAGWDTVVAGITTGKWDIVPSICATEERAKVVDFSDADLVEGGALGFKNGNTKITSIEGANNPDIVFADIAGSYGEQISKAAFPKATHKAFANISNGDLAQTLLSGRADAAIFDSPVTTNVLLTQYGHDSLKFLPSADGYLDVKTCQNAYAFKKGANDMKDALNAFFASRKQSGEMKALWSKWFTPEKVAAPN